jgi:Peptidase S46
MSEVSLMPSMHAIWNRLRVAAVLALAACSTHGAPPAAQPTPVEGPPQPAQVAAPAPAPTPAPAPAAAQVPTRDTAAASAAWLQLDTVHAGTFDQGKMWTFELPPTAYFEKTYGFRPDSAWFADARLGALRLGDCSASFVSPHGLILTNHHCAREYEKDVQRPGEDILDNGFFATTLADERPVKDFHADQLIDLVDVTAEVNAKLDTVSAGRLSDARQAVLDSIQARTLAARGGKQAGIVVEMVSLYNGARTSAYVFRRYTNVKLVAVPELEIGYFGGDYDNFTYPRYNLDFSIFRAYGADGKPLDTPHYFPVDTAALRDSEPIFVVGNPGSTSRLQTVAQLEFRRDIGDRDVLSLLRSRMHVLGDYMAAHPDVARKLDLQTQYFEISNSEKAYAGQVKGLEDPAIIARRQDAERQFQDSIDATATRRAKYGDLISRMAALQQKRRTVAPGFGAFIGLSSSLISSATLHRALIAFQILNARHSGADNKALEGLIAQLDSVPQQPAALDRGMMAARFRDFVQFYGDTSSLVHAVLAGRSPDDAAAEVVSGSALSDSARAAAQAGGDSLSTTDPAIDIVRAYVPTFARFQQTVASVYPEEDAIAADLGRARFAIFGSSQPPDATFSLRIQDGIVAAYGYNGTVAPWHTTFYGMYNRYYSFLGRSDWALPARWVKPPASLDLSTPLDFVSTADIIGGNSGSPVLNQHLRLVGLVFDGNIESLSGDYIYMPGIDRAVSVDIHGILAALDHVYGLHRLVAEMETGHLEGGAR